jgi:hypothetical protein
MASESQPSKVEAIYQLRDAVEAKAQAERELEEHASAAARDGLLAALLDVEAKTQAAIDVCHECGEEHPLGTAHAPSERSGRRSADVVHVDFRGRRVEAPPS